MRAPLIVFAGGGIGSCMRALLLAWLSGWGGALPAPVLLANLFGAFALGIVFVLADEARALGVEARLFLAVGILGGFTTFSTFGWGADLLLGERADRLTAGAYVLASALGGILAVRLGLATGRPLGKALDRGGRMRHRDGVAARMASVEAEDRR